MYLYTQIKNVPIIDNFNDDHTHLGLLDFDKLPGLKRSCGSFSSCNPCRWMLRSSKCWRIQENILGGDGGGFGRKFGEFNGRVFFVGKLEKSIHMGSKKSNRVQNPTWLLFLFFSTGTFFFRQVMGVIQWASLYITHYLHWKRFHHVQLPTQSSQFVMPKLHGSRRGPFLSSFSCVQQPSDLISS